MYSKRKKFLTQEFLPDRQNPFSNIHQCSNPILFTGCHEALLPMTPSGHVSTFQSLEMVLEAVNVLAIQVSASSRLQLLQSQSLCTCHGGVGLKSP
jgi:hypothetical protein